MLDPFKTGVFGSKSCCRTGHIAPLPASWLLALPSPPALLVPFTAHAHSACVQRPTSLWPAVGLPQDHWHRPPPGHMGSLLGMAAPHRAHSRGLREQGPLDQPHLFPRGPDPAVATPASAQTSQPVPSLPPARLPHGALGVGILVPSTAWGGLSGGRASCPCSWGSLKTPVFNPHASWPEAPRAVLSVGWAGRGDPVGATARVPGTRLCLRSEAWALSPAELRGPRAWSPLVCFCTPNT